MKGYLILGNGIVFEGRAVGATGKTVGEVVFNTTMIGYQKILTDPSNQGLIINMTYPLIGNYGINHEENESDQVHVAGLVMRECCDYPNHWMCEGTFRDYLQKKGVIALEGIDTRALTRQLRNQGSCPGILVNGDLEPDEIKKLIKEAGELELDKIFKDYQAVKVSPFEPYLIPALSEDSEIKDPFQEQVIYPLTQYQGEAKLSQRPGKGRRVVVIDCGVKRSVLLSLYYLGFELVVVPQTYTARQIIELEPAGIVLSNGPGNPAALKGVITTTKELLQNQVPVLGICLGHLILGLALGGRVQKMHFGHRGGSYPVKDLDTGKVLITSQNHGYILDESSLNLEELRVYQKNLNDGTIEGIEHRQLPAIAVQYQPIVDVDLLEIDNIFSRFIQLINNMGGK